MHRVLKVAAELFVTHRFEDVSMTTISREARCSKTTMYEVYSSKEKLFIAALSKRLEPHSVPNITGIPGFELLLNYAWERITAYASPDLHIVLRAVARQPELMRATFAAELKQGRLAWDSSLLTLIEAAAREGHLRDLNQFAILDIIKAMTTHEPLHESLLYGLERIRPVSTRRIMRNLFSALVSDSGAPILRRYLHQRRGD